MNEDIFFGICFGIEVGIVSGFIVANYNSLENKIAQYNKWAKRQFPNSTANSSLEGLKREIIEVEEHLQNPYSEVKKDELGMEYVDCLMYILDSSRRAGIKQSKLFRLFSKKLNINKKRNWKINEDKSYSHIK